MTLAEKLRLMQVKRYPICHTNRDQSVAEHSYNVMLIAMELAAETLDIELVHEVLRYGLMHDMEEVFTGDIPSSFKRELRAKCPDVVKLLDGTVVVRDEVKAIVKLADCIEAIYYLREFGGSRLSVDILDDILRNFDTICQTTVAKPLIVQKARNIVWAMRVI